MHPFHFLGDNDGPVVIRLSDLDVPLQSFIQSFLEILSVQSDLTVKVGTHLRLLILSDL